MKRLNGWQRIWIVATGVWVAVVLTIGSLWIADGGLHVFTPPEMVGWTMKCTVEEIAQAFRSKYASEYSDLSDADLRSKIETKYSAHLQKASSLTIYFWIPTGVDGSNIANLSCADTSTVVNPTTKQEQVSVFATLDTIYPTWQKGHDLNSALGTLAVERVEQSKRD